MKILVLGAGAVGGYFGGRMAEAGADVTFLVRARRAELLAKSGLRIKSRFGDLKLAPRCVVEAQVKPDYDVVLFTAKAYDLASAIDAIAPAMTGNRRGYVLPMLNGISHMDALDARFGRERVLGGVAYIASTLAPDGEIQHLNEFQRIVFGPRAAPQKAVCEDLSAALAGVKFDWKQLDDVEQAMWDKWVLLATLAGITCLMRAPVGDIVAAGSGEKLILALLAENASVAKAEGYATPEAAMANYRGLLTQKGSMFSASMLRDVESGGQAEGEHILGALLARARKHGISAPVLEMAATNLEAYAARRKREKASESKPGPTGDGR
jgi:2-dehydropantoate 2-reductase